MTFSPMTSTTFLLHCHLFTKKLGKKRKLIKLKIIIILGISVLLVLFLLYRALSMVDFSHLSPSTFFTLLQASIGFLGYVPSGLKDESVRRLNKGKLYISKTTPSSVIEAYSQQFQNDFSCFLESRSLELVDGGRVVLSFMGRESMDPAAPYGCYHWELLAQALMTMVSEGIVEEEKVDSFNAPYYACCDEELKMVIEKEGSFSVDSLETYEIDWDEGIESEKGEGFARLMRAAYESLLEYHFGSHIMDDLFGRYARLLDHHFSKTRAKCFTFNISLFKRQQ